MRKPSNLIGALLAALLSCTFAAAPAFAHHGWSWTDSGFFQLEGVITEVYVGNPHATIDVNVEGTIWRVELAPPGATIAAGFTEDAATVGDQVIAIGNRSSDPDEARMKAVRIIIGDDTYDVYPSQAQGI